MTYAQLECPTVYLVTIEYEKNQHGIPCWFLLSLIAMNN